MHLFHRDIEVRYQHYQGAGFYLQVVLFFQVLLRFHYLFLRKTWLVRHLYYPPEDHSIRLKSFLRREVSLYLHAV